MESLAATAISILGPYLVIGAEEFTKSASKEIFNGAKALVDRLRKWWSGDPVAAAAADNLPKDPQRYGTLLGGLLSSDLARDEVFASELRKLVDDLGPSVEVIQKMEAGRGITGAEIGKLISGHVSIRQEIGDAENVIGFKADQIGGA